MKEKYYVGIQLNKDLGMCEIFDELEKNEYKFVPDSFPEYNSIFLDGTQFKDINSVFKQIHFKEIKSKIWFEELDDGLTIEKAVLNK